MMAHFGKNPVSGGRPPMESNKREVIVRVMGSLFHIREIEVIVVEVYVIRTINIGIVRRI